MDRTTYSVRLTLWGKLAEQYNLTDQPVIAFKGVKVGDFQGNPRNMMRAAMSLTCPFAGRSLSMYSSSTMHVDPDIPDAHALRGWYDATGAEQTYQSHTITGGGGGGGGVNFERAEVRSLIDVKNCDLGMSDKVDVFSARATIMHIKSDNIAYPACPTQGCNKKVVQLGDDWRCEKCDKSYPAPEHRSVSIPHCNAA